MENKGASFADAGKRLEIILTPPCFGKHRHRVCPCHPQAALQALTHRPQKRIGRQIQPIGERATDYSGKNHALNSLWLERKIAQTRRAKKILNSRFPFLAEMGIQAKLDQATLRRSERSPSRPAANSPSVVGSGTVPVCEPSPTSGATSSMPPKPVTTVKKSGAVISPERL